MKILTNACKISTKTAKFKTKEQYKELQLDDVSKAEKDYINVLEDMEIKSLGGKGKN